MRKKIKRFLEINDTGKVNFSILWDTLKAAILGKIFSCCAYNKKEKQNRWINLHTKLKSVEAQHKKKRCPNLLNEIEEICIEIIMLYTEEIQKKFVFVKQKYYGAAPKRLEILTRRLQKSI